MPNLGPADPSRDGSFRRNGRPASRRFPINTRVRQLMEERELSNVELGKIVRRQGDTIRRVAAGYIKPGKDLREDIAQALKAPESMLWDANGMALALPEPPHVEAEAVEESSELASWMGEIELKRRLREAEAEAARLQEWAAGDTTDTRALRVERERRAANEE
jgi:hypothetical protein